MANCPNWPCQLPASHDGPCSSVKLDAPCKGLVFRVRTARFASSAGVVTSRREYRPLVRRSCSGCAKCDWMWDDLAETNYKFIDGGKDGDVVKLQMTNISHDPETGYVDDYDLAFVVLP